MDPNKNAANYIFMKINGCILSLGTNLGDRYSNLTNAIQSLTLAGLIPYSISSIYETEPWGYHDSNPYLNMTLRAQTQLDPNALLNTIKHIEQYYGRIPSQNYSSRTIDIDILFFNRQVIKTDQLTIPHPELSHRKFVLVPLNEIATDFIHPKFQMSIHHLLEECQDPGIVIKFQEYASISK